MHNKTHFFFKMCILFYKTIYIISICILAIPTKLTKMKIDYPQLSDEELLNLWQKGDSNAANELYNRYKKEAILFCMGYVRLNKEDALDVWHDTLSSIITSFLKKKKELQTASFKTYLFVSLRNNAIRYAQKKQKRLKNMREHSLTNLNIVVNAEQIDYNKLPSLINDFCKQENLKKQEEEILRLKLEGLSNKDVAEILGIHRNTVSPCWKELKIKFSIFLRNNYDS